MEMAGRVVSSKGIGFARLGFWSLRSGRDMVLDGAVKVLGLAMKRALEKGQMIHEKGTWELGGLYKQNLLATLGIMG